MKVAVHSKLKEISSVKDYPLWNVLQVIQRRTTNSSFLYVVKQAKYGSDFPRLNKCTFKNKTLTHLLLTTFAPLKASTVHFLLSFFLDIYNVNMCFDFILIASKITSTRRLSNLRWRIRNALNRIFSILSPFTWLVGAKIHM